MAFANQSNSDLIESTSRRMCSYCRQYTVDLENLVEGLLHIKNAHLYTGCLELHGFWIYQFLKVDVEGLKVCESPQHYGFKVLWQKF